MPIDPVTPCFFLDEALTIHIITSAELTLRSGHTLTVPVHEGIESFVSDFGNPAAGRCLVVIDGRMYRDVAGLVYVSKDGERLDALKCDARDHGQRLEVDPDVRPNGDYVVFRDPAGCRYRIDGKQLAALR